MLPLVTIVGRPNVGKSTLVNRLSRTSDAIVTKEAGVTRDRNYTQANWRDKFFLLVDTGGFVPPIPPSKRGEISSLSQAIVEQALLAIEEGTVIILVVGGQTGLLPQDEEIAQVLRKSQKPVIVAVNKIDSPSSKATPAFRPATAQFFKLGLGEPLEISALHGLGIGELLDKLVFLLPSAKEEEKAELTMAIVGRPNVGKSTLLNQILKKKRALVDEEAGTTRDAISSFLRYDNKRYAIFDTAGLKKKSRTSDLEYYGLVRALKVLGRADLSLVVLDAKEGVTRQDLRIGELAKERGSASIILLNKKDLVGQERLFEICLKVKEKFHFLSYAPIKPISALTGAGISSIFPLVKRVGEEYRKRIPTPKLNQLLKELNAKKFPLKEGRKLKFFYATQIKEAPPTFVFFVNLRESVSLNLKRYLEKILRGAFGFEGTPLRLYFREKSLSRAKSREKEK